MQYVKKEPPLAATIIAELCSKWPKKCCAKEVLFLDEIESILEQMEPADFDTIYEKLFKKLAQAIMSHHFQVGTRALMILNNEALVRLFGSKRSLILPIIFKSLYSNTESHWNETVSSMSKQIMDAFMNMDMNLFNDCFNKHMADVAEEAENLELTRLKWEELDRLGSAVIAR